MPHRTHILNPLLLASALNAGKLPLPNPMWSSLFSSAAKALVIEFFAIKGNIEASTAFRHSDSWFCDKHRPVNNTYSMIENQTTAEQG